MNLIMVHRTVGKMLLAKTCIHCTICWTDLKYKQRKLNSYKPFNADVWKFYGMYGDFVNPAFKLSIRPDDDY